MGSRKEQTPRTGKKKNDQKGLTLGSVYAVMPGCRIPIFLP